jgi:hypothetical protein
MAAPTSYTETQLATFMLSQLGDVADVLGWTGLPHLHEAVNETLLAYGADIDDVTDIAKLRALARREAWRLAVTSLITRYDFSNPEGDYKRSQMVATAQKRLADSEFAALPYDTVAGTAYITDIDSTADPYVPIDEDEWAAV